MARSNISQVKRFAFAAFFYLRLQKAKPYYISKERSALAQIARNYIGYCDSYSDCDLVASLCRLSRKLANEMEEIGKIDMEQLKLANKITKKEIELKEMKDELLKLQLVK